MRLSAVQICYGRKQCWNKHLECLVKGHCCACAVPHRQFKFSICKIQAYAFPAICQDGRYLSLFLLFTKAKGFVVHCPRWLYQMKFSSASPQNLGDERSWGLSLVLPCGLCNLQPTGQTRPARGGCHTAVVIPLSLLPQDLQAGDKHTHTHPPGAGTGQQR